MKAIVSNISGWSWVNKSIETIDDMENDFSHLVLIEMICSSVTLNDLKILMGESSNIKPGIIIGHEGVGRVKYIPSLLKEKSQHKNIKEGDIVVFHPFISCSDCDKCKVENFLECINPARMGFEVDGVFSNFIKLPLNTLFKVPNAISPPHALYLESVATALASCENERILKSKEIALVGQGEVASLLAKIIDHKLSSITNNVSIKIVSPNFLSSYPNRFDAIIEAWSDPSIAKSMIKSLKNGGTLLVKKRPNRTRFWAESEARGKSIYVEYAPNVDYQKALDWMQNQSNLLSFFHSTGFEFSSNGLKKIFDIDSSHENLGKIYFDFLNKV